ncbi:hypothetical protein [Photobacterium atrarenae]|uniref:Uncharacterized protein n=1 Tax=Photobacterium atrarenae TaxID=865757 RepID=A0ABY5GQQ1_9GAMM|nr:hypothetical protein [Photobacterium atrarenae]UTV30852.1 hypothetical protein NNL38_20055 [Photobacterium atrarenae]
MESKFIVVDFGLAFKEWEERQIRLTRWIDMVDDMLRKHESGYEIGLKRKEEEISKRNQLLNSLNKFLKLIRLLIKFNQILKQSRLVKLDQLLKLNEIIRQNQIIDLHLEVSSNRVIKCNDKAKGAMQWQQVSA